MPVSSWLCTVKHSKLKAELKDHEERACLKLTVVVTGWINVSGLELRVVDLQAARSVASCT